MLEKPKKKKLKQWTPTRKQYTIAYLEQIKKLLKLEEWTVETIWETASEQPIGLLKPKVTQIIFSRSFLDESPVNQTQIIVQELLRCHARNVRNLVTSFVAKAADTQAKDLVEITISNEVELLADALADAIAPFMPEYTLR